MHTDLKHLPVMADEVISYLQPKQKKKYIDGTFGQGGHSKKILSETECSVLAIDRDSQSQKYADELKKEYPNKFSFFNEKFSNLKKIISGYGMTKFDGLILDLGISNTQLNDPSRGFSFSSEGPLDMRMDKINSKLTAERIINEFDEKELSDIFFHYGDEKNSRKIAKSIVSYRKSNLINTTSVLSEIIKKINKYEKKHPATRVFQALRIFINDELKELNYFLNNSKDILTKKSRIVILSFHSIEDRIVKNFFKENSKHSNDIKFGNTKIISPLLKIITKKPLTPSLDELKKNNRSRSAKMRVAEII